MQRSFFVSLKALALGSFTLALSGCGTDGDPSVQALRASKAAMAGNYLIGMASCSKGQFDPVAGNEYLKKNKVLANLAKDSLPTNVEILKDEFLTSAPSTLFGAGDKNCVVTTKESLTFPSDRSIALKLKSRSCSSTCSISDCKEEKIILDSPSKRFEYTYDGTNLSMLVLGGENACVIQETGIKTPAVLHFTKK